MEAMCSRYKAINIFSFLKDKVKSISNDLCDFFRCFHKIEIENRKYRDNAIKIMSSMPGRKVETCQYKNILVDGMWNNANYWFRYSIFRKALSFDSAKITGLLGEYQRKRVLEIFKLLDIEQYLDFYKKIKHAKKNDFQAKLLIKENQSIFDIKLPYDMPIELIYDGFLKKYKRSTVKITDPEFLIYLSDAIKYIEVANELIEEGQYDLVLLSHCIDVSYASMAVAALRKKIPVFLLYGNYGVIRYIKLSSISDIFNFPDRPKLKDIELLCDEKRVMLESVGSNYMKNRFSGGTNDLGAIYAYQKKIANISREAIIDEYQWDKCKPIICVYGSVWYDYPHSVECMPYDDFYEWIKETLDIAVTNTSVNWLFKGHPCDEWYGKLNGMTMENLVNEREMSHIRLVHDDWDGFSLLDAIDGVVTCHGTIGIEAAFIKKPVLVTHKGWYGDIGFTVTPESRDEYKILLNKNWWEKINLDDASTLAKIFSGFYFGIPELGDNYIYQDDANQDAIYWDFKEFYEKEKGSIENEMKIISDWVSSNSSFYHTYKVVQCEKIVSPLSSSHIKIDPRARAKIGRNSCNEN
jgi:Capsule polysaccharide biosynthesis protein